MTEQTIQLDIGLLLPEITSVRDDCVAQLEQRLENQRGIQRVHINHDTEPPQLCLHFDPNLISLATVERMARDAGSRFTQRYRHETIPFSGMTTADAGFPARCPERPAADGVPRSVQPLISQLSHSGISRHRD